MHHNPHHPLTILRSISRRRLLDMLYRYYPSIIAKMSCRFYSGGKIKVHNDLNFATLALRATDRAQNINL